MLGHEHIYLSLLQHDQKYVFCYYNNGLILQPQTNMHVRVLHQYTDNTLLLFTGAVSRKNRNAVKEH